MAPASAAANPHRGIRTARSQRSTIFRGLSLSRGESPLGKSARFQPPDVPFLGLSTLQMGRKVPSEVDLAFSTDSGALPKLTRGRDWPGSLDRRRHGNPGLGFRRSESSTGAGAQHSMRIQIGENRSGIHTDSFGHLPDGPPRTFRVLPQQRPRAEDVLSSGSVALRPLLLVWVVASRFGYSSGVWRFDSRLHLVWEG